MDANFDLSGDGFKNWSLKNEKTILEPYTYLLKNSGKGFRRNLSLAFNHWFEIDTEKLDIINEVIEMLHNSSLLIDDIEDNSALRRGSPTAQKIFGTPLVLNCGNYVYFIALQKCLTLGHDSVPIIFTEQMLRLHRGQGLDIFWRDTFSCPTEDEYKTMVILKTGGLFGLAIQLMQLFSKDERNYESLLDNLGLLFQIRDDLANLVDETKQVFMQYHSKKTFAEDLSEGKFSYPIVKAIHKNPDDHQILSILRQRPDDMFLKRHCIELIREMGALDYTVKYLIELENKCRAQISELGGNPHLESLLNTYSKLYRDYQSAHSAL